MKVTLREVAQEVGLSITTVSRALNGYDDVAEETKQTIKATAEALGYTPNLNARRLKTKRADSIGLILPTENLRFSDPFFSELLSGIVEQSAKICSRTQCHHATSPGTSCQHLYAVHSQSSRRCLYPISHRTR